MIWITAKLLFIFAILAAAASGWLRCVGGARSGRRVESAGLAVSPGSGSWVSGGFEPTFLIVTVREVETDTGSLFAITIATELLGVLSRKLGSSLKVPLILLLVESVEMIHRFFVGRPRLDSVIGLAPEDLAVELGVVPGYTAPDVEVECLIQGICKYVWRDFRTYKVRRQLRGSWMRDRRRFNIRFDSGERTAYVEIAGVG
jgi:hypothetical protein